MKKAYLYIVIAMAALFPLGALAAEVRLTAQPVSVGVGDRVAVTLSVDTFDPLNSFSGTLTYNPALLTPTGVSDGGSISSIWLTRPKPSATSTQFVGFAAGGFVGHGDLFTVIFTARTMGTANVTLTHAQFLQNDGQGTEERITVHPLALQVGETKNGGYQEQTDTTPPESFTLTLGKDTALFDGHPYLVFAPVDKGSGIDHVEVGETRWPFIAPSSFAAADSPYALKDQYGTSRVVVRAYDRAGNVRAAVVPRQHLFRPYELAILGTLLLALLLWLFLKRRSRA